MPKSTKKSSNAFWAMIGRETAKYGLTTNDFKTNPAKLYLKSKKFRNWVHENVKEPQRMKIANNKHYNLLTQIHNLPDNQEALRDLHANAPPSWKDAIEIESEIQEQNIKLSELFNTDLDELPTESNPEPEPTPSTSKQSTVDQHFKATKPHAGNDSSDKSKKREPSTSVDQETTSSVKKPKKATSITGTTTTDAPPQTNPPGSQQVDTDRGPEHNTGGTLQGEAGNRHVQKKSGPFGLIKVMAPAQTKTFFFGFKDQKKAENYGKLIYIIYPQVSLHTFTYKENIGACELSTFFVLTKLPFNINYKTLKDKMGIALDNLTYFWHINLNWDDMEKDDLTNVAIDMINIHIVNKVKSLEWEQLIEAEEKRSQYRKTEQSTSKAPTFTW